MKMKPLSETVRDKAAELYAILASVAAKRAVEHAGFGQYSAAECSAEQAVEWMRMSSAEQVRWTYSKPRMP